MSNKPIAASNEVTHLSPSSGDERHNPFFSHFLFLSPVQTCRPFADCRAAALEETLQRLTCLRSTFIWFNKNKSHVAFLNHRKPWRLQQCVCATFIMSFLQLKWQLQLFGLRGHSGSFIISASLFISIWPWISISCCSLCCSLSCQVANVYDFRQRGLLLFPLLTWWI